MHVTVGVGSLNVMMVPGILWTECEQNRVLAYPPPALPHLSKRELQHTDGLMWNRFQGKGQPSHLPLISVQPVLQVHE